MDTITPESLEKCKCCWHDLAPGALACQRCHALVHAEKLEAFATLARALEAKGDFQAAREHWLQALPLLPPDSKQAEWIRAHTGDLEQAASRAGVPQPPNSLAKKLAPLGPVAILLAKGKSLLALFKLNFLFSLFAFMGLYWSLYGARFGIGFALMVLVHEMGHYLDIKRRGLPVDMPVFLPGLGAYVRWQALGVSAETRAAVSLAGPLAGWIAAVACALIWWITGDGLWAALARAGAWLNVLNLIPVWVLDGGQAVSVLNKAERLVLLTACLALWFVLRENLFFLVAAGATYSLFIKGIPSAPSRRTTAYFVTTLVLLGVVMRLIPGHGFEAK